MTRPNATRLVGVYQWARDNPEEHNQLTWGQRTAVCGTALCIAGKVVSDDATPDQLVWVPDDEDIEYGAALADTTWWLHYVEVPHADPIDGSTLLHISERARDLLGLTEEQAEFLFDGANTLDIIRDYIASFVDIDPEGVDALERAAAYDAATTGMVSAILSPDSSIPGADAIAACATPTMYLPTIQDGPR